MRIGAIVQARFSSQRLPGKVLRPVAGKPMLEYLVDRLRRAESLDVVVLATSVEPDDEPVAELAERLGIPAHRGPLENVAERFRQAADRFELDAFVRISGDSPFMDPAVVDRGAQLFLESGADLVTNVMPRTFPPGQSVEVVRTETFRRACAAMQDPEDFEHVTKTFYKHPETYRIVNFTSGGSYPGIHHAIDTPEQFAQFEAIVKRMDRPHWEYGWEEVVRIHRSLFPEAGAAG